MLISVIVPVVKPLVVEDCHFVTLPTLPVSVIVVPFPLHIVAAAGVAVPPTDAGVTVTVAVVLVADEQTPLWTTAL